MMKKGLLILVSVGLLLSCSKDDDKFVSAQDQLAIDVVKIDKYLEENNITALPIYDYSPARFDGDTGVRYVIDAEGAGATPNENSAIRAKYEGRLMSNEEVFDSGNDFSFTLGVVIPGWQIGLPFFKEGESGTLYIPSGWAYGPNGRSPSIPGDAILIFDIELLEVK